MTIDFDAKTREALAAALRMEDDPHAAALADRVSSSEPVEVADRSDGLRLWFTLMVLCDPVGPDRSAAGREAFFGVLCDHGPAHDAIEALKVNGFSPSLDLLTPLMAERRRMS